MLKSCAVLACLVVLFAGTCGAEPGEVLWTARYVVQDYLGVADSVSCLGNQIYAQGLFWNRDMTDYRSALLAYDARTGQQLWDKSFGGAVKAAAGRVYVAGNSVKALKAAEGAQVWETALPSGTRSSNLDLDGLGTKIFVAGDRLDAGEIHGYFAVLGLNAAKGTILWEKTKEGEEARKGRAEAITVSAGRVFAAGAFYDDANYRQGFAVRAYTTTGKLLWEDVQWPKPTGTSARAYYSFATAVVATFNRVYVAGSIYNLEGGNSFAIRAYDAATGKLLWEDRHDEYAYYADAAETLLVQGGRVFAGGYVTRASAGRAYTVRAYDAAKGTLLWSNMDYGYHVEDNRVFTLAAVGNSSVYAAGTAQNYGSMTVRAYDAKTGGSLWENFFPQEGIPGVLGDAVSMCASGGRLFAGGRAAKDDVSYTFTVRSYSVR